MAVDWRREIAYASAPRIAKATRGHGQTLWSPTPAMTHMPSYFEPIPAEPFDPTAITMDCIESGTRQVLLDEGALPSEFFDLSTRLAGDLLHRLGTYRIRLACVVPDPAAHSSAFEDFHHEANRGSQYRFFRTREEAVAWLEGSED